MSSRRPETLSDINKTDGATLVELVITIVIISVAIAGVVGAFSLIAGRSADPLNQTRAVALAQRYMDEILSKPYDERAPAGKRYDGACEITSTSSRDRDQFRDVDDYDELDEAPSEYWGTGDNESGYVQFSVAISVVCDSSLSTTPEPKRIDITITDPSGNSYLFSAYRGNL
ncbi:MSHA biogenesis protein MshD [Marinobacter vulgaris]|uniref:MSHA biogenesis protein MshD n=1 Tax=Marinobacter vulgaris TaxID=1928331 RepID=A0A2V3ZK48_9GAMM|nr:type II secretion system protein [Marinobacter vulgaris]PXX89293.1 MSHA biogenesis protein MshD [Marinobacter vulgaris]TSJ68144.1 type II secretion system protein [Marinobacter vulgaris]